LNFIIKCKWNSYFLRANKIAAIIKNTDVHPAVTTKPNQTLKYPNDQPNKFEKDN